MRKPVHAILLCGLCAAAVSFLGACATDKPVNAEGLSAIELFQRGQESADKGNYTQGIAYYSLVEVNFPDDVAHVAWAQYEIAFLTHKMGRDAEALPLLDALLARYDKDGAELPPAPKLLAQKLKARIEASLPKPAAK
jgi:outer membrane protein assembly factor BamD (BamD/ComL family)